MYVLKFIWQMPQILLGKILIKYYKASYIVKYKEVFIYKSDKINGGISLGNIIITNSLRDRRIKHEYGHSIQSQYLGWVYLLVIGLPSIIMAQKYINGKVSIKKYYSFYTEKWADKLGGVK
jgi:hypothetical protein